LKLSPQKHRGVSAQTATSICIIEHGRLPTTDYFILPAAVAVDVPVELIDSSQVKPPYSMFPAGTLVIFVRYVDDAWAKVTLRSKEAGLLAGSSISSMMICWTEKPGIPFRKSIHAKSNGLPEQQMAAEK